MKSVLVIENDEMTQMAIRNLLILQWPHLSVFIAENGPKGLHLAHEIQPDLILLEDELPGLDSHQTAKVLRHLPETQSIPLIALIHNHQAPDEKVMGVQDACHASLTKPIVADELIEIITAIHTNRAISG